MVFILLYSSKKEDSIFIIAYERENYKFFKENLREFGRDSFYLFAFDKKKLYNNKNEKRTEVFLWSTSISSVPIRSL